MRIRDWLWCLPLMLCFSVAGAVDKVRVGFIDQVNIPFVLDPQNPDGERPGVTLELLRLVQQRSGTAFDYQSMPWARCLHLLKNGEIDAVFHSSFVPARQEYGVYPMHGTARDPQRRLVTQSYYIYALRQSALSWDGERFSGLDAPLGVVIDFSIKKDLVARDLPVDEAPDTLTNLRKLKAGRIAAVINYSSQTDNVLAAHPVEFSDVVKLEPPYRRKTKYLMFSHQFYRANTELAERIWDELAHLHRSGEYAAIDARYAMP